VKSCGSCTVCCTVPAFPEMASTAGEDCKHKVGDGCGIYSDRPQVCRVYFCGWTASLSLGPRCRPDRCGILLELRTDSNGAQVVIAREAWKGAHRGKAAKRLIKSLARTRFVAVYPPGDLDGGHLHTRGRRHYRPRLRRPAPLDERIDNATP